MLKHRYLVNSYLLMTTENTLPQVTIFASHIKDMDKEILLSLVLLLTDVCHKEYHIFQPKQHLVLGTSRVYGHSRFQRCFVLFN